jgi:hypothetical protein
MYQHVLSVYLDCFYPWCSTNVQIYIYDMTIESQNSEYL